MVVCSGEDAQPGCVDLADIVMSRAHSKWCPVHVLNETGITDLMSPPVNLCQQGLVRNGSWIWLAIKLLISRTRSVETSGLGAKPMKW